MLNLKPWVLDGVVPVVVRVWSINHKVGCSNHGRQTFGSRFLLCPYPLAKSAMMSTLTVVHCRWEDEMAREWTSQPPMCWGQENEVANMSKPWLPVG